MPNAAEPTERAPSVTEDVPEPEQTMAEVEDTPVAATEPEATDRPMPKAPPWAYRQLSDRPPETGEVMGRPRPTVLPAREVQPGPAPAPLTRSLGPVGKHRSPWVVPLLSVLTLGVYALYWHSRVNTEMRDFDPGMHVRPGRSTLAVAIPWAIGLLVSLAGALRIVLDQLQVSLPFDPHFTVLQGYYLLAGILVIPYLVLALSFSATAVCLTLERVRNVEDCAGHTTDVQVRPARTVWWLAVPITGGLVIQGIVQRRLNAVWQVGQPSLSARISQY